MSRPPARSSTKRKLAAVAIAMLVAAPAAGCANDNGKAAGSTTTVAAALTKAEFVARADEICRTTTATIHAAATKLRAESSKSGTIAKADVKRFLLQSSLPAYDRMLVALRDLSPPKADEQAVDGLVASLAGAIDAVRANPDKYTNPSVADPFADANRRARDNGLKVCGS